MLVCSDQASSKTDWGTQVDNSAQKSFACDQKLSLALSTTKLAATEMELHDHSLSSESSSSMSLDEDHTSFQHAMSCVCHVHGHVSDVVCMLCAEGLAVQGGELSTHSFPPLQEQRPPSQKTEKLEEHNRVDFTLNSFQQQQNNQGKKLQDKNHRASKSKPVESQEAKLCVCHASLSVACVYELSDSAWHDPSSVVKGQQEGQLSTSRKPGQQLTNNGEACTQDKMPRNFQVTRRASPVGALLSMLSLGRVASFWGRVGSLDSKNHGTALTQLPSQELTDRELEKKPAPLDSKELRHQELSQQELDSEELSLQELDSQELSLHELDSKELSHKELSQKELSQEKLSSEKLSQKELSHQELTGKELAKNNNLPELQWQKHLANTKLTESTSFRELTGKELAETLAIPHQGGADEAPLKQAYRRSALKSHRSTASRGSTSFLLRVFLPLCLCILSTAVSFSLASTLQTLELPRVDDKLAIGFRAEELVEKDVFNKGFGKKELGKKKKKKPSTFWEEETEKHKELENFFGDLSLDRAFEVQLANRWLRLRHLREFHRREFCHRGLQLSIHSFDFKALSYELAIDFLALSLFHLTDDDYKASLQLSVDNFDLETDDFTMASFKICFRFMLDSFYNSESQELINVDLVLSIFMQVSILDLDEETFLAKNLQLTMLDSLQIGNFLAKRLQNGNDDELAIFDFVLSSVMKVRSLDFKNQRVEELVDHSNLQSLLRELVEYIENTREYKEKRSTQKFLKCQVYNLSFIDLRDRELTNKIRSEKNFQIKIRSEKNFQHEIDKNFNEHFANLIFNKLDALLLERHFASAASFQLYGIKAWKKHREASEKISFGERRDKELPHQFRPEQLSHKAFWLSSFEALCLYSFRDSSLKEETFSQRASERHLQRAAWTKAASKRAAWREQLRKQLGREQLPKEQLDQSSLKEQLGQSNLLKELQSSLKEQLESSLDREQLLQEQLGKEPLRQEQLLQEQLGQEQL